MTQMIKIQTAALSADSIDHAFDLVANGEFSTFAADIADARAAWRKYRELVEAPDYPEFLRKYYVDTWDSDPDHASVNDDVDVLACIRANAITPAVREQLMPEAIRAAKVWAEAGAAQAANEQGDLSDDEAIEPEAEQIADPEARTRFMASVSDALLYLNETELASLSATLKAYVTVAQIGGRQTQNV